MLPGRVPGAVARVPLHPDAGPRLRPGPVPRHPAVVVGLGAGHGFKFVPTFGRVLADLVTDGGTTGDLSAFAADRPALVEPDHPTSWLV